MAAGPTDETLREAARHRGFRLVKSRVKTPGKGDYGKFGLVDAKGAPAFGQDGKSLTASSQEIADFLRKGEVSTWATSVETTPQAPPSTKAERTAPDDEEVASVLRPRTPRRYGPPDEDAGEDEDLPARSRKRTAASTEDAGDADDAIERDADTAPVATKGRNRRAAADPTPSEPARGSRRKAKARAFEPTPEPDPDPEIEAAAPEPEPEPAPAPLKIRKATRDDAEAIADLIALIPGDGDSASIVEQLPAKRGSGVLVAERGEAVVGVIAWSVVPTLQRGPVGRVTAIVVAEDVRRDGVGRALLDRAVEVMVKDGARLIEAVSDIEIRNSHRFFRETGFEQTSYRFARTP
ncbi:GNAT family N-acetyltransferase [Sphingomonas montanisoli]|uniref:GNAT family N-acetyltransferase n=1 Tax=Sphingomonas montanisoli TaxID=2606412 RepID=A0A5D9C390_9SPHN|nr:GNAT family N-acetyltransferase [Sphingomonas montanisoli]TZG25747.1 GNAT family N-acetyltransferase [Sphingomonas montanisoli]